MQPCLRIFLFLILCFASSVRAQNPSVVWATQCGNTASDKTLDISLDESGYVFTSGYFNNAGTFGSILLSPGMDSKEVFIAKQDMNGNFLWARTGGDWFDDRGLGIGHDPQGNVLVTGTYWSNATFGPYALNGSADHIFLCKLDPSGNWLWAVTGGSDGDDHGYDMVTNAQGEIYLTGYLSNHYWSGNGTAVFGSLPTFTVTDSIAFLAKLSPTGQWQWVRTFGGTDVQRDNDIALDTSGNIYVAGGYYGTKTFGPYTFTSINNSRDIFVVKYDPNGNFQWVTLTGDSLDDRANGIASDGRGNMYITGEFRDHVIFDQDTLDNHGGPGGKDIFVAKMGTNGGWKWARRAGSTQGGDSGRGIVVNSQGNVFVTGQCKGNVHFGSDTTFNTGADSIQVFVAGIDTTGGWRWAMQMGSPLEDRGYALDVDQQCHIYAVGYFDQTVGQFGSFPLTTYGAKDGFMVRIDGGCFGYSPAGVNEQASDECEISFPSLITPNGDGITDQLNIQQKDCVLDATWRIYNAAGQEVFSSSDVDAPWYGNTSVGDPLPAGIYFYRIEAKLMSGSNVVKSGKILLNR